MTSAPTLYLNGRVALYHGDSRDMLKALPDNSIDSVVTDPPYALVSIVKRFYTSPEWRGLVRDIKAVRGNCCERCGSSYRVAGDHKVELKDGGAPLDDENVELLCAACHNRKTAAARAARVSG